MLELFLFIMIFIIVNKFYILLQNFYEYHLKNMTQIIYFLNLLFAVL